MVENYGFGYSLLELHPSIFFANVSVYNPGEKDEDYTNEYD